MMKRILTLAALALSVAVIVTAVARKSSAPGGWEQSASSTQLKFSHKFHVQEAGVACADCHAAATSASSSDNLRPAHENCQSCHEEQVNEKCDYCHKDPENIAAVPPAVRSIIFSHASHVTMKGVECVTCHPGLENAEYAGPANMPSMETCTTCHNDAKATNTCVACHVSLTNLIPPDHLVASFKKEHRKPTRLGALDVSCASCHTETFCADCHSAAGLISVGTAGLMADPGPRLSPTETPRQMQLQVAHGDPNYRFTHGIDARSKASECANCHSQQDFCAACHAAGGDVNQTSFKPASHAVPNFAILGVGTGGGVHASQARRDIESCASCHDVRGGDPTCITCHVDPDGIRGTNPRTHPSGYRGEDEAGSWHDNPGATCYSCHTDMNASPQGRKGVGFCGYCHN